MTDAGQNAGTYHERSEYEQGAIDAIVDVAWCHGDDAVESLRGEVTHFEDWEALLDIAIRQREREADAVSDGDPDE